MTQQPRFLLFRTCLRLAFYTLVLVRVSILPAESALNSQYSSDYRKIPKPARVTYTKEDSETCVNIINFLQRYHYAKKTLDDEISSEILDRYLSMLDPSKMLFTQADIKSLELIRHRLDNSLSGGDLSPGFHLFNLYLDRFREQLIYSMEIVEDWKNTLDFTMNESFAVNREDSPWPESTEELHDLWRKSVKNIILILKHDKNSDDEITETLKKRYTGRLNRLLQTDARDAFSLFMNAVTMSFDPHTQYFPPRQSEDFDIQMSLSLEGIGAVLQSDNEYTKVVRLIPAGPAEKSRLLTPGDRIIGVGQDDATEIQDIVGWRIDDVVKLIRGPKGTLVRLEIIPADKSGSHTTKTITLKRDTVKLEEQSAHKTVTTLEANNRTYTIGVIDIPAFYLDFKGYQAGEDDYRSTTRDVRKLLDELKAEKIDGLIIDLRDNGGGSLQEVNQLTGLFIPSGPTVQIKSGNGRLSLLNDPDEEIVYSGPLVVMTNRMSASASEIFAGAIKDYNRGIIVGTRTFGKGTVQALQPIDKGQLKLTSAKFYRISGESTQSRGVEPDIEFPNIYNVEETGESSLKGFLPWDTSDRARYRPYKDMTPLIDSLKKEHIARASRNPGFIYLQEKYDLSKEMAGVSQWPLDEQERNLRRGEMDKKELAIENRYREQRGLALISSVKELDDEKTDSALDNGKAQDDPLLDETRHVLADFIELARSRGYSW